MNLFSKFAEAFRSGDRWDSERISDEWFRAHFFYATDLVHEWLEAEVDVKKAKILNFGCGDGITDLSLVLRYGATSITGIDIRQEYTRLAGIAKKQIGLSRIPAALKFQTIKPSAPVSHLGPFDAIITWSTFEHVAISEMEQICKDLYASLRPGGVMFLQIEPLYYSPYGSHLRRYDERPWQHLYSSNEELWKIIESYHGRIRADEVDFGYEDMGPEGYKKFVFQEYLNLNKITADQLVEMMKSTGFELRKEVRRYVDFEPAQALTEQWPIEILKNNEIFLMLKRPE